MKKKIALLFISIVTILLVFLIGNCAIQSLINIINNSENIKPPVWDVKFRIPLISHHITTASLVDPDSFIFKQMDQSSDATFDKVTEEDLKPGGRYYYPAFNNFGLKVGDYVIRYEKEFPGSANFLGSLDNSIDNYFDANFIYSLPCPVWPVSSTTVMNVTEDSLTSIDLSGLLLDINGDGSRDVTLKGIESQNARISLRIYLDDSGTTRVPSASSISINYLQIEGDQYHFGTPSVSSNGLIYTSTDFLKAPSYYLNFGGDPSSDFSKINIENFNFTLNSGSAQYVNCTLKVEASITFGDNYSLKGDIYAMSFKMGVQPVDIGELDPTTDPNDSAQEKLAAYFISTLSMDKSAIVFDAINSLPLSINMTDMFDDTTDSVISPPTLPSVILPNQNGGVVSYFDSNGDFTSDHYELLSFSSPTNVIVPAWTSGDPVQSRTVLYSTNSNMYTFIEQEFSGVLRRPRGMFFISNITTDPTTDAYLGILNNSGGLYMKVGLYIPISAKVVADKEVIELLEAIGFNEISSSTIALDSWPVQNINEFGVEIKVDNKLPLPMKLKFKFYSDSTTDNYTVYLTDSSNKNYLSIISGSYKQAENGEYYVGSNSYSETILSLKKGFTYYKDNTIDSYNGTFYDFFKEKNTLKMGVELNLLETKGPDGQPVAVRFSDYDYITITVNITGLGTFKIPTE